MSRRTLVLRAVEWLLDVEDADPRTPFGMVRVVLSGTVVIGLGVAMAARTYVRAGFRWPDERARG